MSYPGEAEKIELSLSRFQTMVVPPSHARLIHPRRIGLVVGGYVEVIFMFKLASIYLLLSSSFIVKHVYPTSDRADCFNSFCIERAHNIEP